MARPQMFNQQKVISKAIECFWIKGYSETSLADLLAAMEISRSTFYNSFGDKRQLFELCLQNYGQQVQQILAMTLLSDSSVIDSSAEKRSAFGIIKQFLYLVLITPDSELSARGCLLVNTIAETAKSDGELNQLAAELLKPIKSALIHQLKREFDDASSTQHGEWLFTQLLGWRLQCQLGLDKGVLEQQINWTLAQLKNNKIGRKAHVN
ncbi:MAG: TetR/AcrR family transcriptional regulator [Oleispira sp.]|nr:TetR/AcrR family transcriptional regulator [Oleispira sp.]MBL4881232.1 TetR/AcrR family transcriptional regulator [Oleispira sp.]